jgi:O-antigen ligase
MPANQNVRGFDAEDFESPRLWFIWLTLALVFIAAFIQPLNEEVVTGICLALAGGISLAARPRFRLRLWVVVLSWLMLLCCGFAWLPADLMLGKVLWRDHLAEAGLDVGKKVIIQDRLALETTLQMISTFVFGLFLMTQRVTKSQLKNITLVFVVGVGLYTILAAFWRDDLYSVGGNRDHFGFFKNRNHTGTFLAMGGMVGIGCLFQAIKENERMRIILSSIGSILCFYGLIECSISRGGVLVSAIGIVLWLILVGRRGFGKNGKLALFLLFLAVVGSFFLYDSNVKKRIDNTTEKARVILNGQGINSNEANSIEALDLRVPIAKDAISMILASPIGGFGFGQFQYIFPFYRVDSQSVNDVQCLHPESDWLWLASEFGIPGTIAFLVLILGLIYRAIVRIRCGRLRLLRYSCLVAAIMVAIHGVFDVPGHRFPICWSAILLYSLSIPYENSKPASFGGRLTFLILNLFVFSFGVYYMLSISGVVSPTSMSATEYKRDHVFDLIHQDREINKKAKETGVREGGPDKIEMALTETEAILELVPMDKTANHLRGALQLEFVDYDKNAANSFKRFLALDPYWVKAPLIVAATYASQGELKESSISEIRSMWRLAHERARWLDGHFDSKGAHDQRVYREVTASKKQFPELRKIDEKSQE